MSTIQGVRVVAGIQYGFPVLRDVHGRRDDGAVLIPLKVVATNGNIWKVIELQWEGKESQVDETSSDEFL